MLFVSNSLFSQTKFLSGLYCESDTTFVKGLHLSETINVKKVFDVKSNSGISSISDMNGKITGVAINRLGSTFSFTSNNLSGVNNIALMISSSNIVNGYERGVVTKCSTMTKRFPDVDTAYFTKVEIVSDTVVNKTGLLTLRNIKLGSTSFNSSTSRGNFFTIEDLATNNLEYKTRTGDSSKISKLTKIGGSNFPGDDADYQLLLGELKSFENTGWFVEVDRLSPNMLAKRYDLGRAMRKDYLIRSERQSTSPNLLSKVGTTYQIIGDTVNLILKTELTNGVVSFYVYDETAKDNDYWILLNDRLNGNVLPLNRKQLLDIFAASIEKGGTLFFNLTSLVDSRISVELYLSQAGGKISNLNFKNKGNAQMCKLLEKFDDGTNVEMPNGNLLSFDLLNSTIKEINITGSLGKGKYLSNISNLSWMSFGYTDTFGSNQNVNFLIMQENVQDNADGQNPSWKQNKSQFQNEIYCIQLSDGDVIAKSNIKLLGVAANGKNTIIPSYTECYTPMFIAETDGNVNNLDRFYFTEGYAKFFTNPTACGNSNAVVNINDKQNNLIFYPNPISATSHGLLHLNKTVSGSIYSVTGEVVAVVNDQNSIDVKSFAPGVYYFSDSLLNSAIQFIVIP